MNGVSEYVANQRIGTTNGVAAQRESRQPRSKQIRKKVSVDLAKATLTQRRAWLEKRPGLIKTPNDPITYHVNGLAMGVHNELGPGHHESVYHDALAAKLAQTDLAFLDEPEILIELEDGTPVHKYVPDFIVQDNIIVELKAQTWPMSNDDMAQVFDYFAGTDCEEALFYDFGRPRLDYHRLLRPAHLTLSLQRKPKRTH